MSSLLGILIPVTGPLDVVEFDTFTDVGRAIGVTEEDGATFVWAGGDHLMVAHHVHVGPEEDLNHRASVLASFNGRVRVYHPACYVSGLLRPNGFAEVKPLDGKVDEVMERLYRDFGRGIRTTFAPPVP